MLANPGLAQVSSAASATTITQATLGTNMPVNLGECVINMQDTFKSLFKAMGTSAAECANYVNKGTICFFAKQVILIKNNKIANTK